MIQLDILQYCVNQAARIDDSPFGSSKGKVGSRIVIRGFEDNKYWVAAKSSKPLFPSLYISVQDMAGSPLWINKKSFCRRFCSSQKAVELLLQLYPLARGIIEQQRPDLLPKKRSSHCLIAGWIHPEALRIKISECTQEHGQAPELSDSELDQILENAQKLMESEYFHFPNKCLVKGLDRNGILTIYLITQESIGNRVKKAIDLKNGDIIAIKIVEKENEENWPTQKSEVSRAAQAMGMLKGEEGVVQCYFYRDIGDICYLGMEYCDQGDLYEALKDEAERFPTEEKKLKIAIDIASGLRNIHRKGLFHGNIRHFNILLTQDGRLRAKIGDFDYSQSSEITDVNFCRKGSLEYFSPEKCAAIISPKKIPIDFQKDDIWAFGRILHEIFDIDHSCCSFFSQIRADDEAIDQNRYLVECSRSPDKNQFPTISNREVQAILAQIFTRNSRALLTMDSIEAALEVAYEENFGPFH